MILQVTERASCNLSTCTGEMVDLFRKPELSQYSVNIKKKKILQHFVKFGMPNASSQQVLESVS